MVVRNVDGNGRELPDGWVWATLEEVCLRPQYGWTTKAVTDGSLHLLRTTDITAGHIDWNSVPYCRDEPPEIEKYLLHDGDIVISRAGSVGFSHLIKNPGRAIFASYLIRFKPLIDQRYVSFFLQSPSYWHSVYEERLGIAIPNINATKLKQIALPIAPIDEQKRISDEIETQFSRLDKVVAALERLQGNLKRYRASVLKAACEGRLVPTEAELAREQNREYEPAEVLLERILAERRARWEQEQWEKEIDRAKKKAAQAKRKAAGLPGRIRDLREEEWEGLPEGEYGRYLPKGDRWKGKYKEPAAPDVEGLGELPEGWCWATVEELLREDMVNGRSVPNAEVGFPVLRLTAIEDGRIDLAERKMGDWTSDDAKRYLVQLGDFFVMRGNGSLKLVGRGGLLKDQPDAVAFPDTMIRVRVNEIGCNAGFFQAIWEGPLVRSQIETVAHTTAGIYKVNQKHLNAITVPLPPMAEQGRILKDIQRRLSVADALERLVDANLRRAERLRQAILKQAFEGSLAPQDPKDEPAAALLARIQARREGRPVRESEQKPGQMRLPDM